MMQILNSHCLDEQTHAFSVLLPFNISLQEDPIVFRALSHRSALSLFLHGGMGPSQPNGSLLAFLNPPLFLSSFQWLLWLARPSVQAVPSASYPRPLHQAAIASECLPIPGCLGLTWIYLMVGADITAGNHLKPTKRWRKALAGNRCLPLFR